MQTLLSFIHLLSLVVWIGSIVFFSFVAAPGIFKTLEREKAGELVGVIFPKYYFIGYVCGALALVTLLVGSGQVDLIKLVLLLLMLACTLVAGLVIRPRARDLKARMKAEPENGEFLQKKFKSLHSFSVQFNASVLLMGLVLLWFTAKGLNLSLVP
ncbi:MAG: DUF4149 domain-containing protein [Nitrospinae bacterium]|nr:DUF4149 domain-containing protein [Nitrospinota bacterium]